MAITSFQCSFWTALLFQFILKYVGQLIRIEACIVTKRNNILVDWLSENRTLNRSRPHQLCCAYWRMSACCELVVAALSQPEVDWQTARPHQLSILSSSLANLSPNWSSLSRWQQNCRIDETQAHRPIPNLYFLWLVKKKWGKRLHH